MSSLVVTSLVRGPVRAGLAGVPTLVAAVLPLVAVPSRDEAASTGVAAAARPPRLVAKW